MTAGAKGKRLDDATKQKIVEAVRAGESKTAVAKKFHTTIQTVSRLADGGKPKAAHGAHADLVRENEMLKAELEYLRSTQGITDKLELANMRIAFLERQLAALRG
ncbi:predicted protein [Burkholderiales bacterium GJ-E10]|nr:predicted protein [Burkholderiales bacterium GJ-E10]